MVTNFGLLYPASGAGWHLVCDDNFGVPPRAPGAPHGRRPDGGRRPQRLLRVGRRLPVDRGRRRAGGQDRCSTLLRIPPWPGGSGCWARSQRSLFRSDDGGVSFRRVYTLPPRPHAGTADRRSQRRPPAVRVRAGPGQHHPHRWSPPTRAPASAASISAARGTTAPRTVLDFVAIAPDDPLVLYFSVLDGEGDQLWKTSDGGQTVAPHPHHDREGRLRGTGVRRQLPPAVRGRQQPVLRRRQARRPPVPVATTAAPPGSRPSSRACVGRATAA